MRWIGATLAVAVLFLVLTIGVQLASPLIQAEAMAETLAPRLGIPVDLAREELARTLAESAVRHATISAVPWCIVIALLVVTLIRTKGMLAEPRDNSGCRPTT